MPKLRVHNFTISIDGYGAGPDQTVETPLGVGGEELHAWMLATAGWHRMTSQEGGTEGVDNNFFYAGEDNIGATIMGRNMFGPIRGEWPDAEWKGWWGPEPPYHHPVFVLTHHGRDPIPMEGGTTFHFVTDGIESALEQAFAAAGGADVRIGGGVATIQQYLRARLVDELHVAISPRLLGGGERLFDPDRVGDAVAGYEVAEFVPVALAAHVRLTKVS
jgi:dihydrofolate reductase